MNKSYFYGISEEGFHRVAYTEWGVANTSDVATICVHGLTRNSRDFDYLADYLSRIGHHVFCPDIVGRGDSDWLNNPLHYTYEQYIEDMNAMIARTQANNIDWIGTSMGGIIGMILASMQKTPIRRLVLNDIGAQIPARALARLASYAGPDPDFANIDEAKAYYKKMYPEIGINSEEHWQHLTENGVKQKTNGRYATKLDHAVKITPAKSKLAWKILLNPLKAIEGSLFDVDLWALWRNITCPVLIIHGENSDTLLPSTIQKMQRIHPQTEVIEVPNTVHAPALYELKHHEMIYQWLSKTI